jgi:hypothetical protein
MKILFWFNGSGGQRTERKIVDFPNITEANLFLNEDDICNELEDWKHSLRSGSEYQTYGWDENFDPIKMEPLSKI